MEKLKLLVATNNAGKLNELNELLTDLPIDLRGLNEFPQIGEVEETGSTFAENAALKAVSYAIQSGLWALSDDSGLEVEALGGAPGLYSARYGGSQSSFPDKISRLITELNAAGDPLRRARFVCAMSIADQTGKIIFAAEGICTGKIVSEPRGINGFGYDPIFAPEGFEETFGELSSTIKAQISHRARAISQIIGFLRLFTTNELDQTHLGR